MLKGWTKVPRHLVIDTTPLLLTLVGSYDPAYLTKFKRLSTYGYTKKDFEILKKFLLGTSTITVTPGVLAEVFNYLENDDHFLEIFNNNMILLSSMKELYVEKSNILRFDEFHKIAFTDTSLVLAAKSTGSSILTRDWKLYGVCKSLGIEARHLDNVLEEGNIIRSR